MNNTATPPKPEALPPVPCSEFSPSDVFAGLFRSKPYDDLHWSGVGPSDHSRAYFNLVELMGYAPVKERSREEKDRLKDWRGGPPYHIYRAYHWDGPDKPADKHYATEPAAKRAIRAWLVKWLENATAEPLNWTMGDSGHHFEACAPNGPRVANYYFCEEATKDWHKGFRVWFGGTYYLTEFANPDEARAAVQLTWEAWLAVAKRRFLPAKTQNAPDVERREG